MNISRKLRTRIIMGIALLLIVYGLLDRFLHFNVDPKTVNNVSMVLMIIAFALLFSRGDQKKQDQIRKTDAMQDDAGPKNEDQEK